MFKKIWADAVKRREKYIFWTIAAAGLLLRLFYWWEFSRLPHFPFAIGPDVQEYDERARELLNGVLFPSEPEIHAPLYSFFLCLCYRISGCAVPAVRLLQLLMNFSAYVAIAGLLKRLCRNWAVPVIFLALSMFTPVLFFHQAELISETLFAPLLAGFFWQIYCARKRPSGYFSAGLLLGALVLTHGLMCFFAAGEVFCQLFRKHWKNAGSLIAGILLLILPAVGIKSIHYGRLTGVQANSCFNLWLGHNPDATGGCYLRSGEWRKTFDGFRREAAEKNTGESRLMLENIGRFYFDDPVQIFLMPLKKLCLLSSFKEEIAGADPEYLIRRTNIQKYGAGMMAVVIVLGAAGTVFALKKREKIYIHFYILAGSIACGLLLTVVSGRYRQGMMPGLLLLAALGGWHLGRRAWYWIVPLMAASGVIIVQLFPLGITYAASITGEAYYRKGEWVKAQKYLQLAANDGDNAERFANMLGAIAEEQGDIAAAMHHYQRAMREAPGHYDGFLNLGHLYFYHCPEARETALELIKQALARKKELPSAYDMLGQDMAQKKDFKGALQMFELACFYAPDNKLYRKKVELCRRLALRERGKNASESGNR